MLQLEEIGWFVHSLEDRTVHSTEGCPLTERLSIHRTAVHSLEDRLNQA